MKGSQLSAVCVVLLALSPRAQGAGAEPAKGPLTAIEREQCQAQLAELNQSVRTFNAKLEELKALEVEFDTQRAELDKEAAAVDRRDTAAMQALNAKIRRNNELVERHKQMTSEIKAIAGDNKQRDAQFREACENRPAASPSRPPQQSASRTQPADAACNSATGAKDVQRQVDATLAEMRADEKLRQAEVERVAKARAEAQSWSKEKQGKVWLQIIASPKFMAFEREKQPYVQELMRMLGSKPKSGKEECQLVQRIAAMMPAIKAINARQYAFMADEIRAAK
jgi:hypothetical protein